jgi:serine/threonine protein kinase
MAVPAATAADFSATLARTGLVPPEAADQALRDYLAAGGSPADVDAFRGHAVARLGLTEYQAALIQRGRADGFRLGSYTVLDRISRTSGGGGVYKAVHRSGRAVAIKVLPPSKAADPATLTRFQREGRLLLPLDHPHVVKALRMGRAGDTHFIVMEYLDGETLDKVLLRRGRLPAPEAARLARQALLGLHHLHERRIVHRDLKPANLMAVPGRAATTLGATVKLLDVGLGRELFDEGVDAGGERYVTADGTLIGTPDYLPPEQARDAKSVTPQSDQYGLGCVLFHLLAGHPPYPDADLFTRLLYHATEPVGRLPADAPPELQAVVDRLTAKEPADRYPTAADAADALLPLLPPESVRSMPVAATVPVSADWQAVVGSPPAAPPATQRWKGAAAPPRRPLLTGRDCLMMGVGAAATLIAGVVARLLIGR